MSTRPAWTNSRRVLLFGLLLASGWLAGCVESNLVAAARWELEAGIPGASFEKQHAMRLGRLTTTLLRPIALWALRGDEEIQALHRVRRVDLAVYEVLSLPDEFDGDMVAGLEKRMGRLGWSRVVRSREEDEITWVFNRENRAGEIEDLFVVTIDGAEMVMVRVGGQVDKLLAELIADDPGGFGASLGG